MKAFRKNNNENFKFGFEVSGQKKLIPRVHCNGKPNRQRLIIIS